MKVLGEVLTATEAQNLWNLSSGTIRKAAKEKRIKARKSAGTWLTTRSEMIRIYGKVKNEN